MNQNSSETRDQMAELLGIRVDNIRGPVALERVRGFVNPESKAPGKKVYFANVHTFQVGWRNREFRQVVNDADLVLPDGSGLRIAGELFDAPILENLNGTDFTPRVMAIAAQYGMRVYLVGAEAETLQSCRAKLQELFPALIIAGSHTGYGLVEEDAQINREIVREHADIILVALGSPLQEEWIADHAGLFPGKVLMAVGGLFDFLGGRRKRAPEWFRRNGIEWAYRFFQDPASKWSRVFVEIPFFLVRIAFAKAAYRLSRSRRNNERSYA
jgi:N-acetylglucosaminyldiphosphoundecaprenol N-acetyl-beta-D-mannosaminyltransferase